MSKPQTWYRIDLEGGNTIISPLVDRRFVAGLTLEQWADIGSLTTVYIYTEEERSKLLEERVVEEKKIVEGCLEVINDQRRLLEESHNNQQVTIQTLIGLLEDFTKLIPPEGSLEALISLTRRAHAIYLERRGDKEEKDILFSTLEWLTRLAGMKEVEVKDEASL